MKQLLLFLFLGSSLLAQDYSYIGKKILYSNELQNAKKITSIEQALNDPSKVVYLELTVDNAGSNYQLFINNQEKFSSLHKLVIDNRWYQLDLKQVPKLNVFKQLEFLQIYHLPAIDVNLLSELDQLKYLDLDACAFTRFPEPILKLKHLEYLSLSLNYLDVLPAEISSLQELKELDLTNNCFSGIPKELSGIPQLQYLDINNAETANYFLNGKPFCKNSVSSYPEVLKECKQLKKVSLFKVKIPKEIKTKLKAEKPFIKFTF